MLQKFLTNIWYPVRYSTQYYNLSNIPKFYRQFSLKGAKLTYNSNDQPSPFFIMACGRSGNTLLRAVLCCNKKIVIPPESFVIGDAYDKYRIFNHLKWETLLKIIFGEFEAHPGFKDWDINLQQLYSKLIVLEKEKRSLAAVIDEIFRFYGEVHFPEAEIWGDKTPENNLWMKKIIRLFPKARYIFLYRDGRDVVSSFLQAGLLNDLEVTAHYWKLNMKLSESYLKILPRERVIHVKYEEFVSNPKDEIQRLSNFLDIEFNELMLQPEAMFHKLGDVAVYKHYKNVGNPISKKSIGKWRQKLNQDEIQVIEKIMSPYLEKYGYK